MRGWRQVLVVSMSAATFIAPSPSQDTPLNLLTAGVADIHAAVDDGALTYEQLVTQYLARITALDRRGPRLRAVLSINLRAIEIARELDEERRTRGRRSPLHGIPVAVKDNIDTVDMPTTGGSVVFAGLPDWPRKLVSRSAVLPATPGSSALRRRWDS